MSFKSSGGSGRKKKPLPPKPSSGGRPSSSSTPPTTSSIPEVVALVVPPSPAANDSPTPPSSPSSPPPPLPLRRDKDRRHRPTTSATTSTTTATATTPLPSAASAEPDPPPKPNTYARIERTRSFESSSSAIRASSSSKVSATSKPAVPLKSKNARKASLGKSTKFDLRPNATTASTRKHSSIAAATSSSSIGSSSNPVSSGASIDPSESAPPPRGPAQRAVPIPVDHLPSPRLSDPAPKGLRKKKRKRARFRLGGWGVSLRAHTAGIAASSVQDRAARGEQQDASVHAIETLRRFSSLSTHEQRNILREANDQDLRDVYRACHLLHAWMDEKPSMHSSKKKSSKKKKKRSHASRKSDTPNADEVEGDGDDVHDDEDPSMDASDAGKVVWSVAADPRRKPSSPFHGGGGGGGDGGDGARGERTASLDWAYDLEMMDSTYNFQSKSSAAASSASSSSHGGGGGSSSVPPLRSSLMGSHRGTEVLDLRKRVSDAGDTLSGKLLMEHLRESKSQLRVSQGGDVVDRHTLDRCTDEVPPPPHDAAHSDAPPPSATTRRQDDPSSLPTDGAHDASHAPGAGGGGGGDGPTSPRPIGVTRKGSIFGAKSSVSLKRTRSITKNKVAQAKERIRGSAKDKGSRIESSASSSSTAAASGARDPSPPHSVSAVAGGDASSPPLPSSTAAPPHHLRRVHRDERLVGVFRVSKAGELPAAVQAVMGWLMRSKPALALFVQVSEAMHHHQQHQHDGSNTPATAPDQTDGPVHAQHSDGEGDGTDQQHAVEEHEALLRAIVKDGWECALASDSPVPTVRGCVWIFLQYFSMLPSPLIGPDAALQLIESNSLHHHPLKLAFFLSIVSTIPEHSRTPLLQLLTLSHFLLFGEDQEDERGGSDASMETEDECGKESHECGDTQEKGRCVEEATCIDDADVGKSGEEEQHNMGEEDEGKKEKHKGKRKGKQSKEEKGKKPKDGSGRKKKGKKQRQLEEEEIARWEEERDRRERERTQRRLERIAAAERRAHVAAVRRAEAAAAAQDAFLEVFVPVVFGPGAKYPAGAREVMRSMVTMVPEMLVHMGSTNTSTTGTIASTTACARTSTAPQLVQGLLNVYHQDADYAYKVMLTFPYYMSHTQFLQVLSQLLQVVQNENDLWRSRLQVLAVLSIRIYLMELYAYGPLDADAPVLEGFLSFTHARLQEGVLSFAATHLAEEVQAFLRARLHTPTPTPAATRAAEACHNTHGEEEQEKEQGEQEKEQGEQEKEQGEQEKEDEAAMDEEAMVTDIIRQAGTMLGFQPTTMAQALCSLDHDLLKAIPLSELTQERWMDVGRAPRYHDMMNHFNTVSMWVATEVLKRETLASRTNALVFWITVCKLLFSYNAFNGMYAVLLGLAHVSVSRLSKSWSNVPRQYRSLYRTLEEMVDSTSNYKVYRQQLRLASLPCVPFLGLFTKDMFAVEEIYPTMVDGLVNVDKVEMIWKVVGAFRHFQRGTFGFASNKDVEDLKTLLRVGPKALCWKEKQLYSASLKLEPRGGGRH